MCGHVFGVHQVQVPGIVRAPSPETPQLCREEAQKSNSEDRRLLWDCLDLLESRSSDLL